MIPLVVALVAAQRSVPDRPKVVDPEALRIAAGQAKIPLTEAIKVALGRVPGTALRASFEPKRAGVSLDARYEVEILHDGGFYEVLVDAASGEVRHAERQEAPRSARVGEMLFDFEAEELPLGFKVAEGAGAGTPATWRTESATDAPDGARVLAVESKNERMTYNLFLRQGRVGPDLSLSVKLQAWKGKEDQGGGLVWRAKDSDNYYVARWNPLEQNVRVYSVVAGKRSLPFQSVGLDVDPASWHELGVATTGTRIVIYFDGKSIIEAEDATFGEAGAVGLWTKADASTRFDGFRVMPARQ